MIRRDNDVVVVGTIHFSPDKACKKICTPKYLVTDFLKVISFVLVNADEDGAVGSEQIARKRETRINHRAPVRVKPAVALGVGDQAAALLVIVAALGVVLAARLGKVIVVDEIMARVVRRVDVYELHLAGVGFLQDLERVEVVALDVEVLRGVPVIGLG